MKCAADAVRFMEKYNTQHNAYGMMLIDFVQTATVWYAANEYGFYRNGKNAQELLDAVANSMADGVDGARPMSIRMKDGKRSWWADEWELSNEAVTDEVLRMQDHFRAFGFRDVNLHDAEPGIVLPDRKPTAKEAKKNVAYYARAEYWSSRGRRAVQLWTYTLFCTIAAEEYATGKPRFSVGKIDEMIYAPYAHEVRVWLERFLAGKESADAENRNRQAALERWTRDCFGIDVESEVELAKEARRKEAAKPIPDDVERAFREAAGQPGGFDGIMRFGGGR